MKHVLIVTEGNWGERVTAEDYMEQAELLKLALQGEASVSIVATAQEASQQIVRELTCVVVFLTRGMEWQAKIMAVLHPNIRVVIFTGLVPEGEVIWAPKPCDIGTARNMVLCS